MEQKERYQAVIDYFINQPEVATELHYKTPFQLMVAVILSAQCTDKRVNLITPPFFEDFPTPQQLASSAFETVFPYIKSISYPNNKTKYLIKAAQDLVQKYHGEVPQNVEALQTLAGVGRKSAHAIASILYNQPTMAVDTHVMRVSKRIGLVEPTANNPLTIEKQLVKNLPQAYISKFNQWLVIHGRYTCMARKPKCNQCALTACCAYFSSHSNT